MKTPEWVSAAKAVLGDSLVPYNIHLFSPCCGLDTHLAAMLELGVHAESLSMDTNAWLEPGISTINRKKDNVRVGGICGNMEELDPKDLPQVESVMASPPFHHYKENQRFIGFEKPQSTPVIMILICIKELALRDQSALSNFIIEP